MTAPAILTGNNLATFVDAHRGLLNNTVIARMAGYGNGDRKVFWTQFYTQLGLAKGTIRKVTISTKRFTNVITVSSDASEASVIRRCKKLIGLDGQKCDRMIEGQVYIYRVRLTGEVFRIILH